MTASEHENTQQLSVSRPGGYVEIVWKWSSRYTPLAVLVVLVLDVYVLANWDAIARQPLWSAVRA